MKNIVPLKTNIELKLRVYNKEKDEKLELGITIIDEETLIPMVETIENRLYNLNYYLKEKELEILSIGNIVEDTELFKSLLKANELQIEINTKKFNSEKKDRTIKNEIKKMEEELDRIKTNIFKKYNF